MYQDITAHEGKVAIVTGAGRGLGREHALTLARSGAKVVVNDPGGGTDGTGSDGSVAHEVVEEVRALGGEAIASTGSVADWDAAREVVALAIDTYGALDILVNNAGILRDRMLVNMSREEFDDVVDVHLKGTFYMTRHAADHWRERAKSGADRPASVVNTSSGAGLFNNIGQANYAAAKSAIATFSQVIAKELDRYQVRVNSIAPMARTRLVQQSPGFGDITESIRTSSYDPWDPSHVSRLVAYLTSDACLHTGGIWHVFGQRIDLVGGYTFKQKLVSEVPWSVEALTEAADRSIDPSTILSEEMGLDEVVRILTAEVAELGSPAEASA